MVDLLPFSILLLFYGFCQHNSEIGLITLGVACGAGLLGRPRGDRAGEGLERGPVRVLRPVPEAPKWQKNQSVKKKSFPETCFY